MCGPTKAPPVVHNDPVADQKKAEAKATSKSNAALANRRRSLARNSLLTLGAQGTTNRVDTADNLLTSINRGLTAPPSKSGPAKRKRGGDSALDLSFSGSLNPGTAWDNTGKLIESAGDLLGL